MSKMSKEDIEAFKYLDGKKTILRTPLNLYNEAIDQLMRVESLKATREYTQEIKKGYVAVEPSLKQTILFGDSRAAYPLAYLYANGLGVNKSDYTAKLWIAIGVCLGNAHCAKLMEGNDPQKLLDISSFLSTKQDYSTVIPIARKHAAVIKQYELDENSIITLQLLTTAAKAFEAVVENGSIKIIPALSEGRANHDDEEPGSMPYSTDATAYSTSSSSAINYAPKNPTAPSYASSHSYQYHNPPAKNPEYNQQEGIPSSSLLASYSSSSSSSSSSSLSSYHSKPAHKYEIQYSPFVEGKDRKATFLVDNKIAGMCLELCTLASKKYFYKIDKAYITITNYHPLISPGMVHVKSEFTFPLHLHELNGKEYTNDQADLRITYNDRKLVKLSVSNIPIIVSDKHPVFITYNKHLYILPITATAYTQLKTKIEELGNKVEIRNNEPSPNIIPVSLDEYLTAMLGEDSHSGES